MTICLFLALAGGLAVSCSDAKRDEIDNRMENISRDVDTANREARESFTRERDEFSIKVDRMMEKNRQDIAELKEKAKTKKENARKDYDEAIDKLERKNDELKAKLTNYKYESKDKWESFKEEFSHDMDELGASISDLFKDNVKDKDHH